MTPELAMQLVPWLAHGERGFSSNNIAEHLTGISMGRYRSGTETPMDADDFVRCRRLLEAVPLLVPPFPRMAEVSPQWAKLVARWQEICDVMDAEAPGWRDLPWTNAPKAYEIIRECIKCPRP